MQLFGKSAKYAIHAIRVLLARPAGELTSATDISRELAGSASYTNKILQELVRNGVLGSKKGAKGGFYLKRPPQELTLWDLLLPFSDYREGTCAIDNGPVCAAGCSCGMHDFWEGVRGEIVQKLQSTSLAQFYQSGLDR